MAEAVVVASCPEVHQDAVGAACKARGFQKAFGRAGDMVDSLSGKDWVAKWEAKVVMATVTKAQTLRTAQAKIICVSGGKHCDLEMARQPKLVKAIKQEMEDQNFRIRVEWMEFEDFQDCYGTGKTQPDKAEGKGGKGEGKGGKGRGKAGKGDGMPGKGDSKSGNGDSKEAKGEGKPDKGGSKSGKGEGKPSKGDGKPGKGAQSNNGDSKKAKGEGKPDTGDSKSRRGEGKPSKGDSKAGKGERQPDPFASKTGKTPTPVCMFLCDGCGRMFATEQAMQQHRQSKPACGSALCGAVFLCDGCSRDFATEQALQQHWQSKPECAAQAVQRGLPGKAERKSDVKSSKIESKLAEGNTLVQEEVRLGGQVVFLCEACDGDFATEQALQQHWQKKPACKSQGGRAMVACKGCGRVFATEPALQQHWQSKPECNSAAHDGVYSLDGPALCSVCDRVFDGDAALQQHRQATGHGELSAGPRDMFADWIRQALPALKTLPATLYIGDRSKTPWSVAIDRAIQAGKALRSAAGLQRAILCTQLEDQCGHTLDAGRLLRELQLSVDRVYGLLFQWACVLRRQGAEFDYNSGKQLWLPCDCGAPAGACRQDVFGCFACTGCGKLRNWVRAIMVANVPTKTRQAVGQLDLEFKQAVIQMGVKHTGVVDEEWCPFMVVGAAAMKSFMEEMGGSPTPPLLPGVASRIPRAGPLRELDDLALGAVPPSASPVVCTLCARRFSDRAELGRHQGDHSEETLAHLLPELRKV